MFAVPLSVAAARVRPVNVTRNPDGSHNPPYEEAWPPFMKLQWTAGVVAMETGLAIHVSELSEDRYAIRVGSSGQSPIDLAGAYALLDGVQMGAREARR